MSTALKSGELCAGYGGLALAVEEVFGAQTAWFSEFDPAPSKILDHHWPDVPNHGDMTQIDWESIEQVDIISGGTPCQDLSAAGRRKGMTEGTRSNLWVNMREAIAIQQPLWVAWENVRGAFSAEASSEVEFCPGCVGDTSDGRVFLRALGRVLGDLTDLGYDVQWRGLRASDVGAPHARFRVFVLARRRALRNSNGKDVEGQRAGGIQVASVAAGTRERGSASVDVANAYYLGYQRGWEARSRWSGLEDSGEPTPDAGYPALDGQWTRPKLGPGSEASSNHQSPAWRGSEQQHLSAPIEPTAELGERAGTSTHSGSPALGQLAPGAPAEETRAGSSHRSSNHRGERPAINWGPYEPAIQRWESRLGRPAPRPTEPTGRNCGERLSPGFTEWMMGLPDGWVTDPAIGISRNDQLKACGNGVVPQQAAAALLDMLAAFHGVGLVA